MVTQWKPTTGTTTALAESSVPDLGPTPSERTHAWGFDRWLGLALWVGLVGVLYWVGGA